MARTLGQKADRTTIEKAGSRARTWLHRNGGYGKARDLNDTEAVEQFLIASHSTLSALKQASVLGFTYHMVKQRRRRLYRLGRIKQGERAIHPPISEAEAHKLRRLYNEQGYSQRAIAKMRGFSWSEPVRRVVGRRTQVTFYTVADVGRIFGVDNAMVARWAERGWLPNTRSNPHNPRSHYRWTRADLTEFIANRYTWVIWEPRQMTDPELRAYAELCRKAAGGRWWTAKEIAAFHNISDNTVIGCALDCGYLADADGTTYGKTRFWWLAHEPPRPRYSRRMAAAAD